MAGTIGGISGAITGAFIYYRAVNNAKAALTAAETRLEHAKTALENAKSVPPYVTITPLKSHISIYYTPTHTIDISSNIAIKEVQVKITPSDYRITGNDSSFTIAYPNGNTLSTKVSKTFSRYDQPGKYKVEVKVTTFGNGDPITNTHEIDVHP